jgi:hypothetical protein
MDWRYRTVSDPKATQADRSTRSIMLDLAKWRKHLTTNRTALVLGAAIGTGSGANETLS